MRDKRSCLILVAVLVGTAAYEASAFGRWNHRGDGGYGRTRAWGDSRLQEAHEDWEDWERIPARRGPGPVHAPCGDERTIETYGYESRTYPHQQVNVEHVFHHQNRVHHVMHDINQDVYIQNVRVHHNVTHDQTVHHYRHNTRYIEQNVDRFVNEHEVLPPVSTEECRPKRRGWR